MLHKQINWSFSNSSNSKTLKMILNNKLFRALICGLTILFPVLVLTLSKANGVLFMLLALIGLFIYPVLRKNYPLEKLETLLVFSLLFYVFAAGIVILLGDDVSTGARWFAKIIRFAFAVPLFFLLREITITETQFWSSLAVGAIFSGIVAVIELYVGHMFGWGGGHIGRASGITHPIMFGDISLAMGVMAFFGLNHFRHFRNWTVILPVLALIMGLVASFLSGSRGSWIALPALFLILLWSMRNVLPKKVFTAIIVTIIALPALIYITPGVNVAKRVNSTIEQYKSYKNLKDDKSLLGNPVGLRLEMWQASWSIFKDSPLLGVGWGNFPEEITRMAKSGERNSAITHYIHPHNQYLSAMANGGLLGLAATLVLLFMPMYIFYKASRHNNDSARSLGMAGVVLTVAYAHFALTEGMFERNISINFYAFYLPLIVAMITKTLATNEKTSEQKSQY